jgi:hypothetical protein
VTEDDRFQEAVNKVLTGLAEQGNKTHSLVAEEIRRRRDTGMGPIQAFRETGRALKDRNPEAFNIWLDEMVRALTEVADLQGQEDILTRLRGRTYLDGN